MITKFETLADCALPVARCSGCCEDLPLSAPVDVYETPRSIWIVVGCRKCERFTPFQLENGKGHA
jgi:hypothetical protein